MRGVAFLGGDDVQDVVLNALRRLAARLQSVNRPRAVKSSQMAISSAWNMASNSATRSDAIRKDDRDAMHFQCGLAVAALAASGEQDHQNRRDERRPDNDAIGGAKQSHRDGAGTQGQHHDRGDQRLWGAPPPPGAKQDRGRKKARDCEGAQAKQFVVSHSDERSMEGAAPAAP